MATTPTKPEHEVVGASDRTPLPSWLAERNSFASSASSVEPFYKPRELRPSGGDALQALLAFSSMHQQVRRRRALASQFSGFDVAPRAKEFEDEEQFVLDEVLQLVAERAIAITGADGLGIALAENNEIVLRASAGSIKPDVGARIQRDSAFSGACFRTAQIIRCDDTETDDRVNLYACRQLGARSMVAVPLCGRRRVIGLLEAFSAEPFGFNDSDVGSLELLAELILAALKPEEEDYFAESARNAAATIAEAVIAEAVIAEAVISETTISQSVIAEATIGEAKIEEAKAAETKVAKGKLTASAITLPVPGIPAPASSIPVAEPKLPTESISKATSVAPVINQPAQELPVTTPLSRTVESKPVRYKVPFEAMQESEPLAGHHPGMLLVLALVVIAALAAGGLWWKLNNAQLGRDLVESKPALNAPAISTTQESSQSSVAVSSAPALTDASGDSKPTSQSNSLADLDDSNTSAPASPNSVTSQELSRMPHVTGIRHWSSSDSSTVVLDLEDQVQYEAHRLSAPDRIYFDLHDTTLAADIQGKTIDVGDSLLARVRVAQPVSGLTRVVLETKGNSNYSVSLEPNPYRLVVQVRKTGSEAKAPVDLFPEAERKKLAIVIPPATREDLQLRARVPKLRIVVDAGHGGWDLGTVGRRGLLEKDVVLEIAQRLGKLLESRLGAEVILTRNDDNYIPLDERAGIANQAQADLFVSVHANYSDLPSARGVETYYTNIFASPNAKDVETRDQVNKSPSAGALKPAELHEKIEQSRRLAASVQRSLYGTLSSQNPGLRDRGVKAASYVVLTETSMPGILAEVSFVSSPTDEQKLLSDGYREQIAEALYKGIARYASGSRAVKMASAAK